jgi:hypothetical protein
LPADLLDTDWPSPSPELEVRARVRARTRTLRRQRSVPATALVLLALLAVVARPEPGSTVRVATESEEPASSEAPAPETEEPATTTSTTTPTRGTPRAPALVPEPAASVVEEQAPRDQPGQVTLLPTFPSTPNYSTSHPLLVDDQGDAWVDTQATGPDESDPTLDITSLDVSANATTLTTELRLLDLTRSPLASFTYGRPVQLTYKVALYRDDDHHFEFLVERNPNDGSVAVSVEFVTRRTGTGNAGAWQSVDVEGAKGSLNVHTGVIRVTATLDALNRAMAADSPSNEPMTVGTTLVPIGSARVMYQQAVHYQALRDEVRSSDPDFAYRLGD